MNGIAKNPVVGISAYSAPQCIVVEICTEGMLCLSGLNGGGYHDGIDGDDEPLIQF